MSGGGVLLILYYNMEDGAIATVIILGNRCRDGRVLSETKSYKCRMNDFNVGLYSMVIQ